MMTGRTDVHTLAVAFFATLLAAALMPVAAQQLGNLPRTDGDLGKIGPLSRDPRFTPTPAPGVRERERVRLRGEFGGPREGTGWGYRFFDRPVPSYQYFSQPRNFRWSPNMFGPHTTGPGTGPGDIILPPVPTIYNYYYGPRYYYPPPPPRYDPWCDCWHY